MERNTSRALVTIAAVLAFGCSSVRSVRSERAPSPHPTTVETVQGIVDGRIDADGIVSFRGVPYAAPPVDESRWAPASPPAPHSRFSADRFRLPCSQIPIPSGSDAFGSGSRIPSSEDCLYLNVWIPPRREGELLPVMVWTHGGQYLRGAASQYDGSQLARLGRVVVVTVAYRLGPFGFLSHPALASESARGASGNQALTDHLQALRWLQENVAVFGGDPTRVTLFGESAGSATTCALMSSPLAEGLFHRAILQSGACVGGPPREEAEAFGRRMAAALTCANDDVAEELACMRLRSADDVMYAIPLGKVLGETDGGVGYRYSRDGAILPQTPREAVRGGEVMRVPVMLGTTENEMGRYTVGLGVETADDLEDVVARQWPSGVDEIVASYPAARDGDAPARIAEIYSDWAMSCPVRRDARSLDAAGSVTWLYRFRRAPDVMGPGAGAFHGAELAYLFPSVFRKLGFEYDDEDRTFAETLIGYWARFAATGDPNGGGAPDWPAFDAETEPFLILDVEVERGTRLREFQCDMWDRLDGAIAPR